MYWHHECSADWLKARKQMITASDIAKIVPFTDSGRKRSASQVAESMRNVYMSKQVKSINTSSDGAMARGHILEPYAVAEIPNMYHWDDAIIINEKYEGLGYSPDGLSIEQPKSDIVFNKDNLSHIEKFVEVKSYNPDRHIALGTTPLHKLPERWQLAVAFMVTEAEDGELIGFNPEMNNDLQVIHRYLDFNMFLEEMIIIDEALNKYKEFVEVWKKHGHTQIISHKARTSYESICDAYERAQALNPGRI